MIDRQKLEAVLTRRFPGVPFEQIAAAANAIMALDDDRAAPAVERRESGSPVVAPRLPSVSS